MAALSLWHFVAATLALPLKEGPTPEEFNRLLYQWQRFEAAVSEESIPDYPGDQILGKIRVIAEKLSIELDHGGINITDNPTGFNPDGNGVEDPEISPAFVPGG